MARTYTFEEVRDIAAYTWRIKTEIDSMRARISEFKDEKDSIIPIVEDELDDLLEKLGKYPDIFSGQIQYYESLKEGLGGEINRFLASHLEKNLQTDFKFPTPRSEQPTLELRGAGSDDFEEFPGALQDGDDDLPF